MSGRDIANTIVEHVARDFRVENGDARLDMLENWLETILNGVESDVANRVSLDALVGDLQRATTRVYWRCCALERVLDVDARDDAVRRGLNAASVLIADAKAELDQMIALEPSKVRS